MGGRGKGPEGELVHKTLASRSFYKMACDQTPPNRVTLASDRRYRPAPIPGFRFFNSTFSAFAYPPPFIARGDCAA